MNEYTLEAALYETDAPMNVGTNIVWNFGHFSLVGERNTPRRRLSSQEFLGFFDEAVDFEAVATAEPVARKEWRFFEYDHGTYFEQKSLNQSELVLYGDRLFAIGTRTDDGQIVLNQRRGRGDASMVLEVEELDSAVESGEAIYVSRL